MKNKKRATQFWIGWLLVTSAGVVAFGLSLVLFPSTARQVFSLLVYSSPDRIDNFGAEQTRYISLVHAVLGGVMVGWGCILFSVVKGLLKTNHPRAWVSSPCPLVRGSSRTRPTRCTPVTGKMEYLTWCSWFCL